MIMWNNTRELSASKDSIQTWKTEEIKIFTVSIESVMNPPSINIFSRLTYHASKEITTVLAKYLSDSLFTLYVLCGCMEVFTLLKK